jgi:hypothetical protein
MLTLEKANNKSKFRDLEKNLENIMNDYKFCGFAKYVKWDIMSHVADLAITTNNYDLAFLEEECLKYEAKYKKHNKQNN